MYLPSRWSSLRSFPRELRQALVIAAIQTWGAYTEPLSHRQRVARLRSAVSPERQRTIAKQQVLEDLWGRQETALLTLPIAEQERAEELVVRRTTDRQRRAKARSQKRLKLGPGANCGKDEATIFTNLNGKPVDAGGLKRTWRGIVRDAAVGHVRFHDLRHASATYLLQAGVPVQVVSERLGHTRTSTTTDIYAHVMPGMRREAAVALEKQMVNRWPKAREG